jgi:hypothetical protein
MLAQTSTLVNPSTTVPFVWGREDGAQGRPATFGYDYFWGRKLAEYLEGHKEGWVQAASPTFADLEESYQEFCVRGLQYVKAGTIPAIYDDVIGD